MAHINNPPKKTLVSAFSGIKKHSGGGVVGRAEGGGSITHLTLPNIFTHRIYSAHRFLPIHLRKACCFGKGFFCCCFCGAGGFRHHGLISEDGSHWLSNPLSHNRLLVPGNCTFFHRFPKPPRGPRAAIAGCHCPFTHACHHIPTEDQQSFNWDY